MATTLNNTQQNALDLMTQTLQAWGLGSLTNDLRGFILTGDTSPDTLALKLSQTDAYKARFAGNAQRRANGLPELSPAQYVATEEQYRNVLKQYGMPGGFYDSHSDFNNLIGGDVSPTELDSRAQIARQSYMDAPPEFKQYWKNFGLTDGQAVAAILDPSHQSLAGLQQQANAVAVGGTALQQGVNVSAQRATQLAQHGTTLAQAQAAYSKIAQFGQADQSIAARFGTTFDQTQEENSLLLNDAAANQKRQTLYSGEVAQFEGRRGGADSNSLSTASNY